MIALSWSSSRRSTGDLCVQTKMAPGMLTLLACEVVKGTTLPWQTVQPGVWSRKWCVLLLVPNSGDRPGRDSAGRTVTLLVPDKWPLALSFALLSLDRATLKVYTFSFKGLLQSGMVRAEMVDRGWLQPYGECHPS